MEAEDGGPRQPALRPRGGENRIGGRRRPRGRPPTFSRVVSATAVVLVLALALGLRPARAFDVASPIFGAIGNVASYSINKLVIDPERERQVFKVWKELREAEEAEAELEGGASTLSILPEYMKKGRAGKASASVASMPTPPPPPPPPQIAPQIAIRREECASTGILEVLFRGFTPSGKILLWRSPRPAYDSADRKRVGYSPKHGCGGVARLELDQDGATHFMSTIATRGGSGLLEVVLRDRKACDYFAYQAVDAESCLVSNMVVLSNTTPLVLASEVEVLAGGNGYQYAEELRLP